VKTKAHHTLQSRSWACVLVGTLAVVLLATASASAQHQEDQILVGVGKECAPHTVQFVQVYAIAAKIVIEVVRLESPALDHALVSSTTKTDCCPPAIQTATYCWRCCDGTNVCTRDERYKAILVGSAKLTEKEWIDLRNKGLDSVKGWSDIKALLTENPPLPLAENDPRVAEFIKSLKE
jgi:hypothetical protein